jgi:hypothetical protein
MASSTPVLGSVSTASNATTFSVTIDQTGHPVGSKQDDPSVACPTGYSTTAFSQSSQGTQNGAATISGGFKAALAVAAGATEDPSSFTAPDTNEYIAQTLGFYEIPPAVPLFLHIYSKG